MTFKDYFSEQASKYTQYRPRYPRDLFTYLAQLPMSRQLAWDCATGSGQAAVGLTNYFDNIIATDASDKQIANAIEHSKIRYVVAPAEKTSIKSNSIDLVVVAQALHWFDLDRFYAEVSRVSTLGGVLAAWSYGLFRLSSKIDRRVDHFYTEVIGPYWPRERKLVDDRYQSLPFPFEELEPPPFKMEAEWDLDHLIGYLDTWSAVQRFKEEHTTDPVLEFAENLKQVWGSSTEKKHIYWPIHMRVGRVH
jgi:ubiquinone/menaquinone biosynthesis C-methylase UbiE